MKKAALASVALSLATCSLMQVAAADEYGAVALIPRPSRPEWVSPMVFYLDYFGYGQNWYSQTQYERYRDFLGNYSKQLHVNFPGVFSSVLLDVRNTQPHITDINSSPVWSSLKPPTELQVPGRYGFDNFKLVAGSGMGLYGITLNWLALSEGGTGIFGQGNISLLGGSLGSIGGTMRLTTNVHELGLVSNAIKPIVGNVTIQGGYSYSASAGARSYTVGMFVQSVLGSNGGLTLTFDTESQLQAITLTGNYTAFAGVIVGANDAEIVYLPVSVRVDVPIGAMPTVNLAATLSGSGVTISGGNTAGGGNVTVTIDANTFLNWLGKKAGI